MRRSTMSDCPALAQVVKAAMRERDLTYSQVSERAIDPATGYRMSRSLVHNIAAGHRFQVSPVILRALAAGTGTDISVIQQAAVKQFIGLDLSLAAFRAAA